MSSSLAEFASRYNPGPNVRTMQLPTQQPMMTVPGEGITHGVDLTRLRTDIQAHGYVVGYVMGNAPQLTLKLDKGRSKEASTPNIIAKQSKPSRCLAVIMALPTNCVFKNGGMAQVEQLRVGDVDYVANPNPELVKLYYPLTTATAYIEACGGRLPEYAPTACGERQHWTADQIVNGTANVTYVQMKAVKRRSQKAASDGPFAFQLKSTSPRRSLYNQNNIMCLRAVETASVKCSSLKDVYNVNEIAFRAWEFRKRANEAENGLEKAIRACPTQVWRKKYVIDGQEVDGIGSCFFAAGSEAPTTDNGEQIALRELKYMPWHYTGTAASNTPVPVEEIVYRKYRPADGSKNPAMVTVPVTYAKNPESPLFKPYEKFRKFIVEQGFISASELQNLGGRSSKSSAAKSYGLSTDAEASFLAWIKSDKVSAGIEEVRELAARRSVANNYA